MWEEHRINQEQQNHWERVFESFLSLTEFSLIRLGHGYYALSDGQGVNLGNIEKDVFRTAEEILVRMDIYINDYIIEDVEEELKLYGITYSNEGLEEIFGCEYYLAVLKKLANGNDEQKAFVEAHKCEMDYLDLIVNHFDNVDLKNISYILCDKKVRSVSVTETFCKVFFVVAESEEESTRIVDEQWSCGDLGEMTCEDYLDDSYQVDDVTDQEEGWPEAEFIEHELVIQTN